MRFSPLAILSACLTASAVLAGKPTKNGGKSKTQVAALQYIVEFDTSSNMQAAGFKRDLEEGRIHKEFYRRFEERGISITVNQEYTADIFVGATVTFASAADLSSLAGVQGVLSVSPVRQFRLPETIQIPGADWLSTNSNPKRDLEERSTPVVPPPIDTGVRNTGFSILPQIDAEKVNAAGNKGKGIKVGIIDSGVDYTRKPLGGCFGKGCKIAGGYDFVGDAYTGGNPGTPAPAPDSDPLSKCNAHGSIVAGIIGANDNEYGVPGVASEASLYAYRVFGCSGTAGSNVILSALEQAYKDDMDVVVMALQENGAWTESILAVYASRLVKAGIVVTAPSGNIMEANGAFYVASPASGKGVIGAGAVNSTVLPANNVTTSTGYGPIRIYNYLPFLNGSFPIITSASDPTGCSILPAIKAGTYRGPNLAGYVLAVRTGGSCNDVDKAQGAFLANASKIIFAPTQDMEPTFYNLPLIDNGYVSKADGDWIFANAGKANIIVGAYTPSPQYNSYSGGIAWAQSQIGPTNDMYMGVTVMAPGTNIIGVTPYDPTRFFYGWSITPGTSWSSAYAAGAAALYLNARGNNNVSPRNVREALEFSSNPITTSISDKSLLTVAYQGSGVLGSYDSIYSGTVISPTELLLNDTANFANVQYIQITNTGKTSKAYTLTNLPAGTALHLDASTNLTNNVPIPQVNAPATVRFSSSSFTLKAGQTNRITMQFTYPNTVDPKSLPLVSGYIQVSTSSETVTVPYLGVAQSLLKAPVFDSNDAFFQGYKLPSYINFGTFDNVPDNYNYTFDQGSEDYPAILYRFDGGSPSVLLDLVPGNANLGFTPNFNKRSDSESHIEERSLGNMEFIPVKDIQKRKAQSDTSQVTGNLTPIQIWLCKLTSNRLSFCNKQSSFAKVPVVGNIFSQQYVIRNLNDPEMNSYQTFTLPSPQFGNGTTIPNGDYRFLFRGLHIGGDPTNEADYETYLTQPFNVAVPAN